ncbi:MAG: hypothetical protein RL033_6180 [Pseudomonadota bacterium]|jgi:hypothetical protein
MVTREQLRLHGLRAYEWGRLQTAARVVFVLVPLAALCLLESRGRSSCACVATALIGVCIWLRWRDRRGFEVVTTGLRAGCIPLLAGVVLDRLGIECGLAGESTYCTAFAVLVGGAAGGYIGMRIPGSRERLQSVITAAAVAAMAGVIGCVRLGLVGAVGVVGGIALGAILAGATRPSTSPSR